MKSKDKAGRGINKQQQLSRVVVKGAGPFSLLVPFFSPGGVGRS